MRASGVSRRPTSSDGKAAHCLRCLRSSALGAMLVASVSCERPTAALPAPMRVSDVPGFLRLTAPVSDAAMGNLSPVARHVIAALRDPILRRELAVALKDTAAAYSLDLQECRTSSLAKRLLDAGEREGFGSASALCSQLMAMSGAILYMAPERLQGWDGSTIPLVSAIARPDRAVPATIHAYRSTARAEEISMSRPGDGPLLVIVPIPQTRRALRSRLATTPHMIPVHLDTTRQVIR